MDSLVGTFDYTIDDQGRVNIPAIFRRDLSPNASRTFVAVRVVESQADKYLRLYPAEVWGKHAAGMSGTSTDDQRQTLLDAALLEMDSQGRVSIPQKLRQFAGLDRDIVIQGMLDHAELWNKERFDTKTGRNRF